jgi:chromobox protein 1
MWCSDGAKDVLAAYHKKIGGVPEPPAKGSSKKTKGKRTAFEAVDSPTVNPSAKKRGRKSVDETNGTDARRELPPGSWDDHVLMVSSIVEEAVPIKGRTGVVNEKKELIGLLQWKDEGPKTQHKMKVLRQKVPQRLLDYYEQHL